MVTGPETPSLAGIALAGGPDKRSCCRPQAEIFRRSTGIEVRARSAEAHRSWREADSQPDSAVTLLSESCLSRVAKTAIRGGMKRGLSDRLATCE